VSPLIPEAGRYRGNIIMQAGEIKPATESSAIVALVLGIGGIFVIPVLLSIPAIVVGKSAQRKIDESGGTLVGAELAKAGVITGWIGLGLGLLILILIVVGFLFLAAGGSV